MDAGIRTARGVSSQAVAEENARFMTKVYTWMAFGIALSGLVAYAIGTDEDLVGWVVHRRGVFQILIILQLAAVVGLVWLLNRISALAATAIYLLYCALTGTTLSVIFLAFARGSIYHVFAVTAFAFAGLAGFGHVTKRDLRAVGSFCIMGLWGLVGFGFVSLIFPSLMTARADQATAIIGIIVFSGLTAYDVQRIKQLNKIGNEGTAEDHKEAIHGALTLYLDFINLFLSILRIFGRRR